MADMNNIEYSEKYQDDQYEYRHVILPREIAKKLPRDENDHTKPRLLTETEWRSIGVMQSHGWVHYAIHAPEPHILLFRRPLGTDPKTGRIAEKFVKDQYEINRIQTFSDKNQHIIKRNNS